MWFLISYTNQRKVHGRKCRYKRSARSQNKNNSMCQVQKTARMLCGNQIYLVFFYVNYL